MAVFSHTGKGAWKGRGAGNMGNNVYEKTTRAIMEKIDICVENPENGQAERKRINKDLVWYYEHSTRKSRCRANPGTQEESFVCGESSS
jgi:hypothetical protein